MQALKHEHPSHLNLVHAMNMPLVHTQMSASRFGRAQEGGTMRIWQGTGRRDYEDLAGYREEGL